MKYRRLCIKSIIKSLKVFVIYAFVLCIFHFWGSMQSVEAADVKQVACSLENLNLQPYSAKLVWYYKEENGKRYMRLYDATNGVWLTDWIPCD